VNPDKGDALSLRDRTGLPDVGHQGGKTWIRPVTQLLRDRLHPFPRFRPDSGIVPQRIRNRGQTAASGEGDLLQRNHGGETLAPATSFALYEERNPRD